MLVTRKGLVDNPSGKRRIANRNFAAATFARFHRRSPGSRCISLSKSNNDELPTVQELSNDPFMKQVSHASKLVPILLEKEQQQKQDDDHLKELLVAQLSHSDGIRGFFVSYLTYNRDGEEDGGEISSSISSSSTTDLESVPAPLLAAMEQANEDDLVPLACMNVIMPTAMVSMHDDPALSEKSAKTAERGLIILKALKMQGAPLLTSNCQAILAVALGEPVATAAATEEASLNQYWTEFFEKWGYQEEQKRDIAKAMTMLL